MQICFRESVCVTRRDVPCAVLSHPLTFQSRTAATAARLRLFHAPRAHEVTYHVHQAGYEYSASSAVQMHNYS
jgi:hypothetical protein